MSSYRPHEFMCGLLLLCAAEYYADYFKDSHSITITLQQGKSETISGWSWQLKENQLPINSGSDWREKRQEGCCYMHIWGTLCQVPSNALGIGLGSQTYLASYLGSCHVQINSYDPAIPKINNVGKFCSCFTERILFLGISPIQFLFLLQDLNFGQIL